jgi:hypothetical protein
VARRRSGIDDDDVPRLPRGRGFSISTAHVVKIALTATLLVAVIMFRKPCGAATAKFVNSFDQPVDAAPAPAADLPEGMVHVRLHGLNEEETKAAIEKARAEQAARSGSAGSGSAGSGSAGSGSSD